jgi:large subunit ribosomal protein L30e
MEKEKTASETGRKARKSKKSSLDALSLKIIDAMKEEKVVFGKQKTLKLMKTGKCSMAVYAENAPMELKEELEKYSELSGIPAKVFDGDNRSLGILCKKPFNISALAIVGETN